MAGRSHAGASASALPLAQEAGVLSRLRTGRREGTPTVGAFLGGSRSDALALARTYDVSRMPVVTIGGDGAHWIDTALAHFPQGVRQRDGFHLARDAARGWGTAAGATLYWAVRTGDQATTSGAGAALAPFTGASTARGGDQRLPHNARHRARPLCLLCLLSVLGGAGAARPHRCHRPAWHA